MPQGIAQTAVPPSARRDCGPALTSPSRRRKTGKKSLYGVALPVGYIADWIEVFGEKGIEHAHGFIKDVMVAGKRWTNETLQSARDHQNSVIPHSVSARSTKKKPRLSEHHLVARSRGGMRRGNLVKIPPRFHRLWHKLFGNMTVDETHQFIDIIFSSKEWTYVLIAEEQIKLMRQTEDAKKPPNISAHTNAHASASP